MKGIDSMASIIKRGKSYRAQVSLYKHGQHKKLSKTFTTKKEATLWALEMELAKGEGKELAHRTTPFADFFENWIYLVKVNDVKETTFQNYVRALGIIRNLFGDIQLKDLNDIVVQKKIDEYAETHSRKTTHEVLLKIKTAFRKLRNYVLQHPEDEFNLLVLIALETGMRRGELLAIRPESLYEYGIEVRYSISPTSDDTSLKTQNAKRDVSINKEVYELIRQVPVKENGYIFSFGGFKQSELLGELLTELDIKRTTFHGLRDTHASFLFAQDIDIAYVSKRLGHINIQTTQNYYLELMPEKKHQQDADALNLLSAL